uniref:Secreted protein n=1 Tax=Panagrellus redivivus TaxID=6233 RepID=A0A7E4UMM8_PANRE
MFVILEAWHCCTSISCHPFSSNFAAVAFHFIEFVIHSATSLDIFCLATSVTSVIEQRGAVALPCRAIRIDPIQSIISRFQLPPVEPIIHSATSFWFTGDISIGFRAINLSIDGGGDRLGVNVRILTGFAHIPAFLVRSSSSICFVEGCFGCLAFWDVFRDIVTKYIVNPARDTSQIRTSAASDSHLLVAQKSAFNRSIHRSSCLQSPPMGVMVWLPSFRSVLPQNRISAASSSFVAFAFIFLHPVMHCATFLDRIPPDIAQVGWLCRLILKSYFRIPSSSNRSIQSSTAALPKTVPPFSLLLVTVSSMTLYPNRFSIPLDLPAIQSSRSNLLCPQPHRSQCSTPLHSADLALPHRKRADAMSPVN